MEKNGRFYNVSVLCAGVFAVSWAAIIIRFTDAHPFVIAFYRLFFSVIILLPFLIKNPGTFFKYTKREFAIVILSGLFLALHFIFWISSLFYTTVAASLLMLAVQPLFTALFSRIALKEKTGRKIFLAMSVTFTGIVIVWAGDMNSGQASMKGNILAILGAVMVAAYYTAGRKLRAGHGIIEYIVPVYSAAAFFTLPLIAVFKVPLAGFQPKEYGLFVLLAVVSTIGGHGLLNWSLKHFKAAVVNLAVLGEPVIAGLLALILLNEIPGPNLFAGGFLILAGAYAGVASDLKKGEMK